MQIGRARRHELPPPRRGRVGVGVTLEKGAERAPLSGWTRLPASVQAVGRASTPRAPTLTLPHGRVMHIGRARRHELPPPRRGRVGVGVTLEKAAERAPLSGWIRLPASVQAIGRASTPRPPHPYPPPPWGREFATRVTAGWDLHHAFPGASEAEPSRE